MGSVGTETAEFGHVRLEWVAKNSTGLGWAVLGWARPGLAVLSTAEFGPAGLGSVALSSAGICSIWAGFDHNSEGHWLGSWTVHV